MFRVFSPDPTRRTTEFTEEEHGEIEIVNRQGVPALLLSGARRPGFASNSGRDAPAIIINCSAGGHKVLPT